MKRYAYFIENTIQKTYIDNAPLFRFINQVKMHEDDVFVEQYGSQEELNALLKMVVTGDEIVVRSVQDVAKNLQGVFEFLRYCIELDVKIVSIMEPYLYAMEYYTDFIQDAIKIDINLKREARERGFEKAKKENRVGRKKITRVDEAIKMYQTGEFTAEYVCKLYNISTSTLFRRKREQIK